MHSTPRAERLPAGIPFIVVNEFAERFCYYGINAILAIYMTQWLHFGDAEATARQSLFKSAAYFFPLVGAIVSDVFWAKFRTIIVFSLAYTAGCAVLALGHGGGALELGLFLIAFGTGGIKPCVSTNVGDQFTSRNQHLIERAFSWFYLSINAGALISIALCPWLLPNYGPKVAFGVPGLMMAASTLVFWLGRKRYAVVPPAGRAWLAETFSAGGLRTIGGLVVIYAFVAVFWSLWDQSNGTTWTLQATSDLLDKHLFGFLAGVPGLSALAHWQILPAQIQVSNALFILILAPLFSYAIYPFWGRFTRVTPLRKIGVGLFVIAGSFLIVAWIEARIQHGDVVSVWWQILAYGVLTAAEVLVSITALEFSYKQAPLKMKSFIMALFLFSTSLGNLFTAAVNDYMVRPLPVVGLQTGAHTLLQMQPTVAARLVSGQKIDFEHHTGVEITTVSGRHSALEGTLLVGRIDVPSGRVELLDPIHRQALRSSGTFDAAQAQVSTYALVGPWYFLFFAGVMVAAALLFIVVALFYRERSHVRPDAERALGVADV
jgi:Dipeptide/tripeptide permease